ncbi:hypothetical protein CFIMG_008524RA00001 [Ceratocystis fimbriata CBS 114723]|uniref:Protein prenyltransferase alpha subunit repeat-containing protein 1-B n=1 Tax=Ceratocystis fimbriata CBS 114723 TaxID=1035309 RepID=A0A2C5XHE5_9PEZI|nr:hypothetical protein CFIMG_008524RA00001 [Ceratocystis fimbriata CBS 114723]
MSRALDPNAIAALKTGNHQKVFDEIADVFTYAHNPQITARPCLIEIEILSGFGFDPSNTVLRDQNAVAVPKLRLVQAFFVARGILQQLREPSPAGSDSNPSSEQIHRATAVCLLMDAENLTAANMRKRLITRQLASVSTAASTSDATSAHNIAPTIVSLLRREKWLLDSLLTSRLHRHTKSPTLWNHRRWLLKLLWLHGLEKDVDTAQDLLDVVCVSGERHARNYYAWSHARWVVRNFQYVTEKLVEIAKSWAWKHHTDISGWSFLLFVLELHNKLALSVYRDTLRLTESLQWRNESVWWFLRTVSAGRLLSDDRETLEQAREAFVCLGTRLFEDDVEHMGDKREEGKRHEDSVKGAGCDRAREVWERAKTWVEKYRDLPNMA